jgi:DNA polymerase-3 subunit epsilon/CBS domain-containing protein
MKPTTGATPLASLDAIAIDTETTSLDTSLARIVEIAAISIRDGRRFETLVDPAVAIPPASSNVHGITAETVAGAPRFAAALSAFHAFAGSRVLVGYSIGYDLAILEKESSRSGLAWKKPRSLCVRLLATLTNPSLPDYSLDMISNWLGIEIENRHRAMGDAAAAAAIFRALLPRLAERGVRTLAEAERACLMLTAELETHHRAGWAEPVTRPADTSGALRAVDPYAYRHRIGDIMSSPPLVARDDMALGDAIRLMVERRVSSLFVSPDGGPGGPVETYGIVTERDVMRRIAAGDASAFGLRIGDIATRPLVSIRAAAYVYRAIGRMNRLKIRHLAVRTEDGRLAGIVSARDLLKLRASAAVNLDDAIEDARTAAQMAGAWAMLPSVAEALLAEEIDARIIAGIVSEELRAMTRRAAIIAEAEMKADGHGDPPCAYAVLVLGSGGRGESLLAADQDNAIVFASGEPGGTEDTWFADLATRMAAILDAAAIPFCKGGVMAKNPQWRGSVQTWRDRIADWVLRSRPEDLLNVDIFFDLSPVHGDLSLGRELFAFAFDEGHRATPFAKLLGEQLDQLGSPFAFFGGIQTDEAGRIDLKKFGLFPIVSAARTLAIRHDIRERGTRERLEGLIAKGIGGEADMRAILDAHALILSLMLAQQSRDLHSGVPDSNRVELSKLTRDQTAGLKAALRRLQDTPALVRDLMFGT